MRAAWIPLVAALVSAFVLSGCAGLTPRADAPRSDDAMVPATLAGAPVAGTAAVAADATPAWRDVIAEPRLARLIEQALAHNRDLRLATLNIESARAQYRITGANRWPTINAQAQVRQDLNTLRLLVGAEPAAELLPASGEVLADAAALVNVPAGLPSTVLLRRPDVQSAELSLQAAKANVAAARAALFPTLTLTASAGTASTALSGLFAGGNSTWSFVPTLKLPIFDGGAARAGLDSAQVAQQIKLATYEQTLQTAFKETADALAVRASLAERLDAQTRLVAAYDQTLQLTTRRYQAGAESALAVLTAQTSLYSAQQALISLRLSEQANRLTLYKVLGGG